VVEEKVKAGKGLIEGPYFIEDTGLYITSPPMNNFPGALIKFYYEHLGCEGICQKNRGDKAYVETIIGYYDGEKSHYFKGQTHGIIAEKPQGSLGFGWDAIFIPDDENPDRLSFAELSTEVKNRISMRSRASKLFLEKLSCD